MPYIRSLDGLRGLAVLGILLFHAGHLPGGWLGVDVFFVLSGFLITSLLLAEYESDGEIRLLSFWGRRARRLLPALLAALMGVAAYAVWIARPEELARIRSDAIATLLYAQNWHAIAANHDYWEIFRQPSPLDHTWSLAIEEQFYLLWPPLALLILRRARPEALMGAAAGFALLSAIWMAVLFEPLEGTARVYFGTDTRAAATLAGAALAGLLREQVRSWPGPSHAWADAAALCALVLLVGVSFVLAGAAPGVYRGGLFGVALASVAIVAGLVLAPGGLAARFCGAKPLQLLGIVSYGVYLWHWPLYLVLTPERVGFSGWPLTALRVLLSLLVATASYRVIERPIRRRERLVRRPVVVGAAVSASVALCIWLSTEGRPSSGAPVAFPGPAVAATSDPPAADLLLIGDSLAKALKEAFIAEAMNRGQRVQVMASEGCGVLRTQGIRFLSGQIYATDACARLHERWRRRVAKRRPALVVFLEGWSGEGEKEVAGRFAHPCEPAFDEAYRADLAELMTRFSESGAVSVVVLPPPPSVPDLVRSHGDAWGGLGVEELATLFRTRMDCLNRARAEEARAHGGRLIDLGARVCPGGTCRREIEGAKLRPDGIHFQGPGAVWASRWLFDRLDELRSAGATERRR